MRVHGFLLPAKRPTWAARSTSSNGGSTCHAPKGAAARCCSVWPLAGLAGAALVRRSVFVGGPPMSIYYDKFGLNTYWNTPYFRAHIPADYPINGVLLRSRAFRRLPPRLRELSGLAKQWRTRKWGGIPNVEEWYDDEGYELNPVTGVRLTDEEIDEQWERWGDCGLGDFKVEDIPLPPGGFADPDTWEPEPEPEEPEEIEIHEEQVLADIKSRGQARAIEEYGRPEGFEEGMSDEDLAHAIMEVRLKRYRDQMKAVAEFARGKKPAPARPQAP